MKPSIVTMTVFFKNNTNLQESLKVTTEDELETISKIVDLVSESYREQDCHIAISFNGLIVRVDETIAIKFEVTEDCNEDVSND